MHEEEGNTDRKKRILVFLLRHGEREDEVMDDRLRRRMNPARRFDPVLTPIGHQQAREAWTNLISAISTIRPKKVAVFSSPLRRAVGTAMMISNAADNSGLYFSLPTLLQDLEKTNFKDAESPIPIVIWNGLCDCAAQIQRFGGCVAAIRTGFISCAATPENSSSTFEQNKIAKTWQHMIKAALKTSNVELSSRPIQFWKTEQLDSAESRLVPMTPLMRIENSSNRPDSFENSPLPANGYTLSTDILSDADTPIEEVVRLAIQSECDVCIVTTHREEIRDLYTSRCGPPMERKHLGYCCIGSFLVEADYNSSRGPMKWQFHDVRQYHEVNANSYVQLKTSLAAVDNTSLFS